MDNYIKLIESKIDNELGQMKLELFKGLGSKADAFDLEKVKKAKADHEIIEQLMQRMEQFEDIAK